MCVCARVEARSGAACGGVDAPLTLSCRHAQANVQAADNGGGTALIESAIGGHDGCLRQLLAAKADVAFSDPSDGIQAHMSAARNGQAACLRLLLEHKADVAAVNASGETALIRAAQYGHPECIRELLQAKASVATADTAGNTALAMAQQNQHSKCVEILQGRI